MGCEGWFELGRLLSVGGLLRRRVCESSEVAERDLTSEVGVETAFCCS